MRKISLIGAVVLMSLSLVACGKNSKQSANSSSSSKESSLKAANSSLKQKIHQKKQNKKKSSSQSSHSGVNQPNATNNHSNNTTQSNNRNNQQGQNNNGNSSSRQVDKADPSTWNNIPYKGYPSYNAYLDANNGDPEIQAETARMQHDENVKKGIENPDGSETQNFQNWYNDEQNAWNNGDDNFPDYDQSQQW